MNMLGVNTSVLVEARVNRSVRDKSLIKVPQVVLDLHFIVINDGSFSLGNKIKILRLFRPKARI